MGTVTNTQQWKVPESGAALENYLKRRRVLLKYLVAGYSVREIANSTERSTDAVYTDINKLQTETKTHTIWGAILEAISRGWVRCPNAKHYPAAAPPTPSNES